MKRVAGCGAGMVCAVLLAACGGESSAGSQRQYGAQRWNGPEIPDTTPPLRYRLIHGR